MSDWRDIESAPKDGTEVLLWTDTRRSDDIDVYLALGGEHFSAVQIGFWEEVVNAPMRTADAGWRHAKVGAPTHWQPLPPPPGADPGIPIYASRDATDQVMNDPSVEKG